MRFCAIASGSSGNCIYIGSETTHLLVDVGISGKKTESGLAGLNLSGGDIGGILITHEHSDHIKGIGVFSRKWNVPIYATKGTIDAILRDASVGEIDTDLFTEVRPDKPFCLGDLKVNPMHISHDAADPVAYRVSYGSEKKVAVCTDLGTYNEYTVGSLQGLDAILIEANHDIRMLQTGPYPYYLKQRILGDRGHLCNESSGQLLGSICSERLKHIILGHLSKENNLPELAFEAVRMEINMGDNPFHATDFDITVAKRDVPSEVITI